MVKDNGKNTISLPHNWRRPDVLLASLCINLLALALPIIVLQVYDRVIPGQAENTFLMLMIGMGIVIVLDTLLRIVGRTTHLIWSKRCPTSLVNSI